MESTEAIRRCPACQQALDGRRTCRAHKDLCPASFQPVSAESAAVIGCPECRRSLVVVERDGKPVLPWHGPTLLVRLGRWQALGLYPIPRREAESELLQFERALRRRYEVELPTRIARLRELKAPAMILWTEEQAYHDREAIVGQLTEQARRILLRPVRDPKYA